MVGHFQLISLALVFMLQTRTGPQIGGISLLSARLHASTIRNVNGTAQNTLEAYNSMR